jgi:hypothetical protein
MGLFLMQKQFLMISDNLKLVNSRIESIQSDQDVAAYCCQ